MAPFHIVRVEVGAWLLSRGMTVLNGRDSSGSVSRTTIGIRHGFVLGLQVTHVACRGTVQEVWSRAASL